MATDFCYLTDSGLGPSDIEDAANDGGVCSGLLAPLGGVRGCPAAGGHGLTKNLSAWHLAERACPRKSAQSTRPHITGGVADSGTGLSGGRLTQAVKGHDQGPEFCVKGLLLDQTAQIIQPEQAPGSSSWRPTPSFWQAIRPGPSGSRSRPTAGRLSASLNCIWFR